MTINADPLDILRPVLRMPQYTFTIEELFRKGNHSKGYLQKRVGTDFLEKGLVLWVGDESVYGFKN